MGFTILILLIVLVVASIIINVLGFVRDRRFQSKNRGVFLFKKKCEDYARLSGKTVGEVQTHYLALIDTDIQHLESAQSGGGINN